MTSNYTEFKAWVGPPWQSMSSLYWWNWGAHLNVSGALPSDAFTTYPDTTLNASMTSGSTSASVGSTSGWPNAGGFWVGPMATGQGWEYCQYRSKASGLLPNLIREPLTGGAEHNGAHTSGAPVRFWWPLDTMEGKLHYTEEIDDNLCATSWRCDIGGVLIPQAAIRNNHIVIIQARASLSAAYTNFLVGWLEEPHVTDSFGVFSEWTARILSSADMLKKTYTNGLRVGNLDLALHGTANSTTSLGSPFKERISGDYIAADPDFSAGSAIDDDVSTLWIAERYMGSYNTPAPNTDPLNYPPTKANTELMITQLYINPPVGQSGGRRWVELTAIGNLNVHGYQIMTDNDTGSPDYFNFTAGDVAQGDHILIVEDKAVFESENPLHEEVVAYEKPGFFLNMLPTSGHMSIRAGPRWITDIKWGSNARTLPNVDGNQANFWGGNRIPAPANGQTMRYLYDDPAGATSSYQWWEVGNVASPAYNIGTSPDQWIQIEIAPLGLILRDTITNTTPGSGSVLYLNDSSGPSTAGLPDSGVLQFGSEKIAYSAKYTYGVLVSARASGGTTAAGHAAKDLVYIIDTDGVATDASPVKELAWSRAGGTIYPKSFHIHVSNLPTTARTPEGGSNYVDDYEEIAVVNDYTSPTWSMTLTPSRRVKTILMTIARMTEDPGRPRLNTFNAYADETFYFGDWITGLPQIGDIFTRLLHIGNIPTEAISVTSFVDGPIKMTSAADKLWTIISDYADYTGFRIRCERDSKFIINNLAGGIWTDTLGSSATWDYNQVSSFEYIWTKQAENSQISLKWETIDKTAGGTEFYPTAQDAIGKVVELGPIAYVSQSAAALAARKRYLVNKYPHTLHVGFADQQLDIRAGDLNYVDRQIDLTMQAMHRMYAARSIDHLLQDRVWTTAVDYIQIDREVDL